MRAGPEGNLHSSLLTESKCDGSRPKALPEGEEAEEVGAAEVLVAALLEAPGAQAPRQAPPHLPLQARHPQGRVQLRVLHLPPAARQPLQWVPQVRQRPAHLPSRAPHQA